MVLTLSIAWLAGRTTAVHCIRTFWLDADYLAVRAQLLHSIGDTADQTAAADRHD